MPSFTEETMLFSKNDSSLGKTYPNGTVITVAGERDADCMYIILAGAVEVLVDEGLDEPFTLAILERGNVFGEIALFDSSPRLATTRALGEVRLLSVDKKGFLKHLGEDPPSALDIMLKMAERIRTLIREVVRLRKALRAEKARNAEAKAD